MHHHIFILVAGVACLAGPGAAADPPSADALDRLVIDALKDLNNRGADLNNTGDTLGCYRMYQGGLVVLKPLVAHRPPVQKALDDGLREAERRPPYERAKALHQTIAAVYGQLKPAPTALHQPKVMPTDVPPAAKPEPTMPPQPAPIIVPGNAPAPASFPAPSAPTIVPMPAAAPPLLATLWDRLGGETKVEKLVDSWVTDSLADPKVNLTRDGKYKLEGETLTQVKRKLVGFVSSVSDGLVPFSGKTMKDIHECMSLSATEFDALLGQLKKAAAAQGILDADVQALAAKVNEAKKDVVADSPK